MTMVFKLLALYKDTAKSATNDLLRNPSIIIGSLAAGALFWVALSLFGGLGFAGGMIVGMIQVALVSLYFSWLAATIDRERLGFRDLWSFDYGMFFTVLSVGFVIWIAQFLLQSFITSADQAWILQLFGLSVVLVFNCIPEIIYLQRIESIPALTAAAQFTQRYWIEWFLPFLVLTLPWLTADPTAVLLSFGLSDPLLPATTVIMAVQTALMRVGLDLGFLGLALGAVVANWYMLFRGNLFKSLDSGRLRYRP